MEISKRGNKYLQDSKFWEKENRDSQRYTLSYIEPMLLSTSYPISSDLSPFWLNLSCLPVVPKSTFYLDLKKERPETTSLEEYSIKTNKISNKYF